MIENHQSDENSVMYIDRRSEEFRRDVVLINEVNTSECNVSDIECGIRSVTEDNSLENLDDYSVVVITKSRYNVYFLILVATVVLGTLSIIIITIVVFVTVYNINNSKSNSNITTNTNHTHSSLHNTTFINNTYVSGYYTIENSIIQFKGNGFIQFVETVNCSVLLVGGGGLSLIHI